MHSIQGAKRNGLTAVHKRSYIRKSGPWEFAHPDLAAPVSHAVKDAHTGKWE